VYSPSLNSSLRWKPQILSDTYSRKLKRNVLRGKREVRGVSYGQWDANTFLIAYAHYDHMHMTDGPTLQTVSKWIFS